MKSSIKRKFKQAAGGICEKLRVFESISIDGYFTGVNDDMSRAHAGNRTRSFRTG